MSFRPTRPRRQSSSIAVEPVQLSVEALEARRLMAASLTKIGDVLGYLATDFATRPAASQSRAVIRNKPYTLAAGQPNASLVRTVGDTVLVKAVATTKDASTLSKQLEALGASVTASYGPMVTAAVPVSKLAAVNGLSALTYADASYGAYTKAGKTDDLGVQSMNADKAAKQAGVDGTGVRVGILSDSYNVVTNGATTAAQDVASGDLPAAGVTVVKEDTISGDGADEGRGMAQIVHDVAPGAAISFYTADNSEADFAAGILTLAKPTSAGGQGAQVVVDDVGYYDEPYFQDGVVAQAVNTAYGTYGTSYFSAAGNEARQGYESDFNGFSTTVTPAGSAAATYEDFDPSTATNAYQQITIPAGGEYTISYQWDSAFKSASLAAGGTASSTNSVSVYLLNAAKTGVVASATTSRVGGDAYQILDYSNTSTTTAKTVYLVAKVASGTAPGHIKYIDLVGGNTIQYATNSGTSAGHPVAAGAMGVGAAYYANTPSFNTNPATLESFSSAGGTSILFNANGTRKATAEARNQPSIVAPDGAATTFFYDQYGNTTGEVPGTDSPADGQFHFFGTSAAAPHAAAVAALMLQAKPTLTNAQIYSIMESTASDMGTTGFDYDTGYGLLQADKALAAVSASSVTGTVYEDNNNNGTFDSGDTAVSGQSVFLDDNNNGVADSSTATFTNGTATAIPDATATTGTSTSTTYGGLSRVSSPITSTATGRVTSVGVGLNVTHARFSDLGFTLVTPSGVRIPLLTDLGGVSNSKGTGANITLSDAAASYIESTSSTGTLTGTYKPQTALSAAVNESAAGTWQLEARDYRTGTTGTINSWTLTLGYADVTATTDANGKYTFAGLSPSSFYGTYRVRTAGAISGYALSTGTGYDLTLARSTTATGDNFAYVPNAPSTVASVVLDDGTAQRSRVRSVTVTVNGTIPAANIGSGAFTLTQTSGTGGPYTVNVTGVTASGSQTVISLGFSGGTLQAGSLLDGRYTLTIDGSKIANSAGTKLDAAGNGTAGSSRAVSFFRLATDVTGDGSVTIADFNALASGFNTTAGQSGYVEALDVNGDGALTIADFNELASRFNMSI